MSKLRHGRVKGSNNKSYWISMQRFGQRIGCVYDIHVTSNVYIDKQGGMYDMNSTAQLVLYSKVLIWRKTPCPGALAIECDG